ncbi:MAG: DUF433 domain-containing protein [Gammaproteobacteria bacterium]|nr:DUF433 domain-containing protein [Gammaproteobacteria bacterium]
MLVQLTERIVIDPEKCNGKPIIRGQRITAQTVLEFLGAGDSIEDVLRAYPILEREDIYACLAYASRVIRMELAESGMPNPDSAGSIRATLAC